MPKNIITIIGPAWQIWSTNSMFLRWISAENRLGLVVHEICATGCTMAPHEACGKAHKNWINGQLLSQWNIFSVTWSWCRDK